MRYTLRGARLIDAATDTAAGDVTIDGARIAAAGRATARPGTVIAADGMLVVPGFIDVHTHGGGGCNLHTTAPGRAAVRPAAAMRTPATVMSPAAVSLAASIKRAPRSVYLMGATPCAPSRSR